MYKVAKGGAITFDSFLSEKDRNIARDHVIKTASVNMREAAKIGLQSLYADPKEVLEKYKDFDIVKEMQARKGAKLLWVRARAIDADVVNANGDLFSKEELLKEQDIKGQKIPTYKTFEGVPIYTNHKNDDIEQAKGMVVYAEWDDKENCVYCTFFVDEEAYPDIARNIRTGVIHDVSMGASVEWGVCSICNNKAYTEKDYCEHLKKYKGKTHPESGKKAYEKNYGVKFIELSCVGDGAFESCEIQEIYDVDDVLDAATNIEKKANEISANIILAHQGSPSDPSIRNEYENCLRVAQNTAYTAVRLAQQAGTLVGGPLLAGAGANQNSTVGAILQALGIDPRTGLNILDMINLSLNFLEVAVMNMFARKDNVDLSHVGKITKSMADLQGTMQDMIDEGIDVGSGQSPQPINQPTGPQAPQQAQQAQPAAGMRNMSFSDYTPTDSVGRIMELANPNNNSVGSGVALASSDVHFVWASRDGKREVFASTNTSRKSNVLHFTENLLNLKKTLVGSEQIQNSIDKVIRVANERNKNIKTNTPNGAGGRNQMDHFAKIASEQRKKIAAAVTIDFKVEDNAGNRVVLSTDGSITGYTNGRKTGWDPILNENQIHLMENGQGTRVAAELLKEYSSFVKTALLDVKHRDGVREDLLDEVRSGEGYDSKSLGESLRAHHKGESSKTRNEELESKRTGEDEEVKEVLLEKAGLYSRRVNDSEVTKGLSELLSECVKGCPTEVLEMQLAVCRVDGKAAAHEVMSATINALAKAVVSAKEHPNQILRIAKVLSSEEKLAEMIGAGAAASYNKETDFFKVSKSTQHPVAAVLRQLGSVVTTDITASNLADALTVAVEENDITREGVERLASTMLETSSASAEDMLVSAAPSRSEELRTALKTAVDQGDSLISSSDLRSVISGLAMSASEQQVTPEEVVAAVESIDARILVASIDRAKTPTATEARLRERNRREFWNIKSASTKNIEGNIIGWLADYSTNFDISSKKIALAAKRLCEDYNVAEKLVAKAITVKQNAERTAAMSVTQNKTECLRFVCTKDDLGGVNPSDDSFEDTFKQKAIEVLQQHGFTVDPGTFSFTDLNVSQHGDITATVSTSVSKSFKVDEDMSEGMSEGMNGVGNVVEGPAPEEAPVLMTEGARIARQIRREQILNKYAMGSGMGMGGGMGGGMGAPAPQGPPAGLVDPAMGAAPAAGGDLGLSAMTGGADEMNAAPDLDGASETGAKNKKPWGSVCPVCGSDNVDVADSKGSCNECGSGWTIEMMLKLDSDGTGGAGSESAEPAGDDAAPALSAPAGDILGDQGLGAATAPTTASNIKTMIRMSSTVDADVYLRTAMADFNRNSEKMLPIGMVCPSCGDRNVNKVKSNSFCHACGNYSKTTIRTSSKNPSKLDVSIVWID